MPCVHGAGGRGYPIACSSPPELDGAPPEVDAEEREEVGLQAVHRAEALVPADRGGGIMGVRAGRIQTVRATGGSILGPVAYICTCVKGLRRASACAVWVVRTPRRP